MGSAFDGDTREDVEGGVVAEVEEVVTGRESDNQPSIRGAIDQKKGLFSRA